mgnify:CR=1 FL=1
MPIPEELHRRMIRLRVNEGDLVERFIRGSGPGGQKINKTSSCVQIKHLVLGIEVKCHKSRSLMANRITARSMICSIIEEKEEKKRKEEEEQMKLDVMARDYERLNIEEKKVTNKEMSAKYESYEEAEEDFM